MAEIGWIDFSKEDRSKAKDLLKLIKPEGQLDELGVGSVRDALANQLFPGISTIQTRAKYYFIIPNILRDYQKLSPSEKRKTYPLKYLEDFQHKVKNELKNKYNSKEGEGIIGVTLRYSKRVKRNPSEIYWSGLQAFGFMNTKRLSSEYFLRNLANSLEYERVIAEDESDDMDIVHNHNLDIHTPVNPNWFEELDMKLDMDESDFFKSQIKQIAPQNSNALFPLLLENDELLSVFQEANFFQEFVKKSLELDFKNQIKELLILSYDFAELMEGAHLLYNDRIQKHFFPDDYSGNFLADWIKWKTELEKNMIAFQKFDTKLLLPYLKYPKPNTLVFIERFWNFAKELPIEQKPSNDLIALIEQREKQNKGRKSRLMKVKTDNNDVTIEEPIGLPKFNYRFKNARKIMEDIQNPIS